MPPGHGDRCEIDHIVLNAISLQPPVHPDAVKTASWMTAIPTMLLRRGGPFTTRFYHR